MTLLEEHRRIYRQRPGDGENFIAIRKLMGNGDNV